MDHGSIVRLRYQIEIGARQRILLLRGRLGRLQPTEVFSKGASGTRGRCPGTPVGIVKGRDSLSKPPESSTGVSMHA